MASENSDLIERHNAVFMKTYAPPGRAFVRGEGNYVWDADGKKYLDLLGGIAVNALGHAHPAWTRAVTEQAKSLATISNFFTAPSQIALAEKLLEIAGAPPGSRVYLCSTGTEAVEAALKMALKTGKKRFIALEGSFHGRTLGALSVTHKPEARAPFEPLPLDVAFVPPGDEEALARAFTPDTAAVILEPIQGETGVKPLSGAFFAAARRLCDEHGALLIVDEIQSGIGRTGVWFAWQGYGVQPDIMTVAKGLGGGFPIGAAVAFGPEASALFGKGDHGTTFGGNALACAAALATLDAIQTDGLLENVKAVGEHIREVALSLPRVVEVRGEGLMIGIGLDAEVATEAVQKALDAGFIVNAPRPDTIRLLPALTLTPAEVDSFLDWLRGFLSGGGVQTTEEAP